MLLPEIVTVGIYNSQLVAKNNAVSKQRKTHRFEIELPLEDGGISHIDGNAMPITPNMLICAKPGQQRHTKFPYKCFFLHILLHGDTLYETLMNTPDFLIPGQTDVYQEIFTKLLKHYRTEPHNEIILQSLVLELIYNISQDAAKSVGQKAAGHRNEGSMEQALRYIQTHLTEDLRLETVAKAVSVSPIHFHNVFKAAMGMTLREYVEEQRIKKSIQLLTETDCSLTEIAFACGFSSQSYFSYVFKRKMHQTPREYVQTIYSKYEL